MGRGNPTRVAAVDLGASSGRVILVEVAGSSLQSREAHRFPNRPVRLGETLHWDILNLYQGVLQGLRAAGPVTSVGIDGWAVDYGLLDSTGALLGNPVHYRDQRTESAMTDVHSRISPSELYARTGIQAQTFNTIYQLASAVRTPQHSAAEDLLLIPDLMGYWLTGRRAAERTNASTTGLLDISTRSWATDLIGLIGARADIFPRLVSPGQVLGPLLPHVQEETRQSAGTQVIAVGSHDTASAVAAIPARSSRFAYVATGTWSLVGVELERPVLTDEGRRAGFTNELGVDGKVRYLRNVMGLWLLQECLREWGDPPLAPLLSAAAELPALQSVVDATDPEFLVPGGMPERLASACRRSGQPAPSTPPETVRCILDSLAIGHARAIRQVQALAHHPVDVVHIVGGGVHNALLCQLTADATNLPVLAGPAEAAALGNALLQVRASTGRLKDLDELREFVASCSSIQRYEPSASGPAWSQAEARIFDSDACRAPIPVEGSGIQ